MRLAAPTPSPDSYPWPSFGGRGDKRMPEKCFVNHTAHSAYQTEKAISLT